ncbi:MAG: 4Fe-4S cluster-binding domain-containing protein [Fibromonadales bacterium]|nr:4Fe-4S cluster-binding domain-containing protein [Fibromonadales bacterium]
MTIIELLISAGCDRACEYCISRAKSETKNNESGDFKSADGYINMPVLRKWLLFQKNILKDIQIIISGGEPTINRSWIDLLAWLHENKFEKPIVYTNGLNLKDLSLCETEPSKICKIMLTHHFNSNEQMTKDLVQFMQDLKIQFLVKGLVSETEDNSKFVKSLGVPYVIEGIKKVAQSNEEAMKAAMGTSPLSGDNPYFWRWNGYGNRINREWFKFSAHNYIFTVDVPGNIFNCHLFNQPVGTIYEPKKMENLFNAGCVYLDTVDLGKSHN